MENKKNPLEEGMKSSKQERLMIQDDDVEVKKEHVGKKDFKNKGKTLIICMVIALFLCPVTCDWNDLASSGGSVSLPTYSSWTKDYNETNGHSDPREGDRIYHFGTYGSSNWGTLSCTFADMPVNIKGNKMYDKDGVYVGKIRKKQNGDIVIFDCNISGFDFNGTYRKGK